MCCKGFYTNGYCSMGHLLTPIEIENCYLIPAIRIKNKHGIDLNADFGLFVSIWDCDKIYWKKSHDTISNLLCFPSYRTFVLISVKASFRTIIYWQAALSEWYIIKRVKIKKTRISGLRKSKKRVNGFGTVDNYMGEMYYYLTTFSQQNYTVALLNISNLAWLELLTMFILKSFL